MSGRDEGRERRGLQVNEGMWQGLAMEWVPAIAQVMNHLREQLCWQSGPGAEMAEAVTWEMIGLALAWCPRR